MFELQYKTDPDSTNYSRSSPFFSLFNVFEEFMLLPCYLFRRQVKMHQFGWHWWCYHFVMDVIGNKYPSWNNIFYFCDLWYIWVMFTHSNSLNWCIVIENSLLLIPWRNTFHKLMYTKCILLTYIIHCTSTTTIRYIISEEPFLCY